MHGEKIFNIPLRVCYYCRVSTDSDVQLNSLDNQLEYYENYIKDKKNWTFIKGYVEEGVTGVSVNKRRSFKQMINDAKENKFDLIITKEVSRFARDLEDSIHYIRELKDAGVGVFFENQNLNTFDNNSELVLNIMFNLAQDESRKLSSRVKFGHRQAINKGHILGSSNITGYQKDNCKLVIVEKEAKLIRTIFELYASGEYGLYKLAKKLSELGYLNKNGNLYDKDSLKRMIENPKYKGYYRARTYEIMDYRTKRRKKIPIEEQIIYKCQNGSIPAIVSEELWNKANDILKKRTYGYQNNNCWTGGKKYPFSSKIYCFCCNTNFQRRYSSKSKKNVIWCCRKFIQYQLNECSSPTLLEIELENIILLVINYLIKDKQIIINDMLNLYNDIDMNYEYQKELIEIKKDMNIIEKKKTKMLDLVFNNVISDEYLKYQFMDLEKEINSLILRKKEIINQIEILNMNDKDGLINLIEEEINGELLNQFIRRFVDEIIVSKVNNNRHNIKLDIYLDVYGEEKVKIKGARHINGPLLKEKLILENQQYELKLNNKRKTIKNTITYNVYIN